MSGPQCCANPPVLNPSSSNGSVEEIGGVKSYVSGSLNSKLAALLIPDVFGYEAPILRKLADKVAAAGYYVVVPDLFYGDPYAPENAERPLSIWIQSHSPDKGAGDSKPILEALKSKGISAIGVAGFCWGAKPVLQLVTLDEVVKAGVILHPALITVDDIKDVKVPIAALGAEFDDYCPPEFLKQLKDASNPEVDFFLKIFTGCEHGWSVRYNEEDEVAVKRAEEAHQDLLDWFNKYVK
ncbi:hypothetical protein Sjap_006659 [Stephania japonica]|uniref:Dienelactone hydrolase domain-containing protein n=1 Tax=Stephania japonica TaxID=461633 RepID=A0AAP0PN10_9MAGN